MIFDFHSHIFDKPFNSLSVHTSRRSIPDDNMTKERVRPKTNVMDFGMILSKDVNFTSQTHLESLRDGGFTCVCVSLYPLEQIFTNFKTESKLAKLASLFVKKALQVTKFVKKKGIRLVATTAGYEVAEVQNIFAGKTSYFDQVKDQIAYVVANQNQPGATVQYEIALNNAHKHQIIAQGKLAVIISIEGITSFYNAFDFKTMVEAQKKGNIDNFLDDCLANVVQLKKLNPSPFLITLAHHQYNFVCGNVLSFIGIPKLILKQNMLTRVDGNSKKDWFPEIGITNYGWKMIKTLLDPNIGNGRVLIDTKHMSKQARIEYHQFIKDLAVAPNGERIPIIQTHTAVNGRSFNESKSHVKKKSTELKARHRRDIAFNTGSINMFNEEILDIVESDGLIGIMIDEKRLIGVNFKPDTLAIIDDMAIPDDYKRYENHEFYSDYLNADLKFEPLKKLLWQRKRMKQATSKLSKANIRKMRMEAKGEAIPNDLITKIAQLEIEVKDLRKTLLPFEMSILLNQFFHILEICAVHGDKAWSHICIGTDYEGVINPLDSLYYASDFQDFEFNLRFHWNVGIQKYRKGDERYAQYEKYLFGNTVDKYIEKILWGNSEWFLETHF